MTKWKNTWQTLSRKQKVAAYIAGVLLAGLMAYLVVGCPPLTEEMALRRAERANFIGPAVIVGDETVIPGYKFRMLIGESDHGYTLYSYTQGDPYENRSITYREKTGDITVLSQARLFRSAEDIYTLPVYVFTEYPKAARAELVISHQGIWNNTEWERTYNLHASRSDGGYFRFDITVDSPPDYQSEAPEEADLLYSLSEVLGGGDLAGDIRIPATIRLYDRNDGLIIEKTMEILPYDTYGGATDEN